MNIEKAKKKLDVVINKGRVHFYKPFQIAEILTKHRIGYLRDLSDLESYRNASRKWRDEVSKILVGRSSTSSARYQDNIFDENACPPEAIVALGEYNKSNDGEIEAYIYKMFEAKVSSIGAILASVRSSTPETFDLSRVVALFESKKGLKRSIDKVYEITVYALFSTIVRAIQLEVNLCVKQTDPEILKEFGDFLEKVIGLKNGQITLSIPAHLFRLGSTNAADRGLDMIANFGPAIQVKHLTLDADAIADICDGIDANRIVIVCKDAERSSIEMMVNQLAMNERLQGIVTFDDLLRWYRVCLSKAFRDKLGTTLLQDFIREFTEEFPSSDGLIGFVESRGYHRIKMTSNWVVDVD